MAPETGYWMIFPLIQVAVSLAAGAIIGIYGTYIASRIGGGVLQKAMIMISMLSFLLAAYTVIGLWGYLAENDSSDMIRHLIILFMGFGVLILAYYVRKFAIGLKKMESEE